MSESNTNAPIGPPPEIARLLDSICGSAGFRRSPRLQRFLRYVVEHAIRQPKQPLKELQIAMDVFDRDSGFDPQVDPIVRVEAGRLRLRLTEYYAGPGQNDKVVIDISKGGYVPAFQIATLKPHQGATSGSAHTAAQRLYLKGRFFWGKRTAEGLAKAAEYYRRALAVDSAFALAYLGIADCHLVSATFEFAEPSASFAKAAAAAESVLLQGIHLAEAHITLACVRAFYWRDWRGAEESFQQAIERQPNGATAWQWYGMCCLVLGRLSEGLKALRTATERDPLSLMVNTQLGCGLYLTRRYAEAEEACAMVLEMGPGLLARPLFSRPDLRTGGALRTSDSRVAASGRAFGRKRASDRRCGTCARSGGQPMGGQENHPET